MRRRDGFLACLLAALALAAPLPATAQEVAAPGSPARQGPEIVPQSEIPVRADADERFAQDVIQRSTARDAIDRLGPPLEALAKSVAATAELFKGENLQLLAVIRLESLSRHWNFHARQLEDWRRDLKQVAAQYTEDAAELARRRATWDATRAAAAEAGGMSPALVNRVQAVVVSTGLLRRMWGWRGLSFVSLAQDAGSANHDVAPFASEAEIAPIVAAAGFALPDAALDWHRPSLHYRSDLALFAAAPVSLVGLAMLVFSPIVWAGAMLLLLGALVAVRQHFLWRFERHAIDARQILSQRGWLSPRLVAASRIKLHSVEIAQGPLARRRGYASLRFGLAGGALSFDGLPLTEAQAMREAVLDSIASVDFSALPR
jgi:membrane protein YdbS with pleckstrin-like domain